MSLEDWIPNHDRGEGYVFGLDRTVAPGFFERTTPRRPFFKRLANAIGAAWAVFRGAMRE